MSRFPSLIQRAMVLFPLAALLAGLVLLVASVLSVAASSSPNPFRWPYE
jgi:hypothetical protein